jgi:hypothetical protein
VRPNVQAEIRIQVLARASDDRYAVMTAYDKKQTLLGLARIAARALPVREAAVSVYSGAVPTLAAAASIGGAPHGRIRSCAARRPLRPLVTNALARQRSFGRAASCRCSHATRLA